MLTNFYDINEIWKTECYKKLYPKGPEAGVVPSMQHPNSLSLQSCSEPSSEQPSKLGPAGVTPSEQHPYLDLWQPPTIMTSSEIESLFIQDQKSIIYQDVLFINFIHTIKLCWKKIERKIQKTEKTKTT